MHPTPSRSVPTATVRIVSGRPLNSIELDGYDVLPRALAERVVVHEVPALPGDYVGLTLGRRVFLAIDVPDDASSKLLAHELVHVRQWYEQGRRRFLVDYVSAFLRHLCSTRSWTEAYRSIPAEQEARSVATDWADRRLAAR